MRPGPGAWLRTVSLPAGFGLSVVCLGTLGVPFDSAVNVAFPNIVRSLALPIPSIQWVVIAYTLTYAALMLVFGRIGDIIGYRRIFLLGTGWSCIAFVCCAAAPSFGWLLIARVMQGVGAAMALSCGPALATSLYPESQRTRVLGIYTMIFGIGGMLGSVLAGMLVQLWGWPAVFWFRAPISLLACLMALGLPRDSGFGGDARFDVPGAVMLVLSVSTMLLALNQVQHLEKPVWLWVLALVSIASAVGFVLWERRTKQPLIDLAYFKDRDFSLVNAAHILLNLSGFAVMLLVPFYLDRFGGLSVPATGAVLTASSIGLMIASPLAGRIASFVPSRQLALLGAAAMACGQMIIGSAGPVPILAALVCGMTLQGAGLGLFQVAYFDIVTAALPRQDRGVAGSLVMMTRTVGVVTGATILMLIFQSLRAGAAAGGASGDQAFIAGFHGAFRSGTFLPVIVACVMLLCGWARRRRPA
jgi:MFS family permease